MSYSTCARAHEVELPVDADAWQEDEAEASSDQCSAMNPPKPLEKPFPT